MSVLPAGVSVDRADTSAEALDFVVAGHPLSVTWAGSGDLAQVRAAITPRPPDLLVARRMSPASRQLARSEHIGWVDENGQAEFAVGTIVVVRLTDRSGRPGQSADRDGSSDQLTSWTPAVTATAEALLSGVPGTVNAMANLADIPVSTASLALRYLQRQKFLTSTAGRGPGAGRNVRDRDALLAAYADAVAAANPRSQVTVGVLWRDPLTEVGRLGEQLLDQDIRWAVTGALSAALVAPFATQIAPLVVYLDTRSHGQLRHVADELGLPVEPTGRLTMRAFPSRATLKLVRRLSGGVWSVPWPRAYADLRPTGVRGEEIAEHYREVAGDLS